MPTHPTIAPIPLWLATAGPLSSPVLLPTATPLPPSPVPPTATPPLPSPTPLMVVPSAEPTSVQPAVLDDKAREQVFDQVWGIVKEHYLYADYNGVDWDAVHDEFAPLVATARSNDEFYQGIARMVGRLNDHHSRFGPPAAVVAENAVASGRESSVGIGVLTVPSRDGAFIQAVFPESPAQRADLRPRDRIIAVDGRPYRVDDDNLQGPAGSIVRLNVVRPGEKPRDVVLARQEVQGRITPYYRRFPGDIGYVWISTLWVNDTDEQVSGALTELVAANPLNGLILDLRGNPGGWSHVLAGILSHFVRGQVGVFFDRDNHVRPLVVSPPAGPDLRRRPLVVLIDQDTASYAEVLVAVLQREGNALVVGTPSSGNTETIYAHTLSDGSRLWLAQEGFRLQNGDNLEGQGVQPDYLVDVDWKRYSEEDDPQLLEALRLLGAGPK